jgi:uncharacterized protein
MGKPADNISLLVFAKAPVVGKVKTRLQPLVDPRQSMRIHCALVEHCLAMAATVGVAKIELWVGGPHQWWQQLQKKYPISIHQQQGADLGERMCHAVENSLQRSAGVVIIGTDCPYITADYVQKSFSALAARDIVVGPADDGGYVLIGMRRAWPEIFSGVSWGSDCVLAQTKKNIQRANLSWQELDSLGDIDRPEDLQQLRLAMPELARQFIPQ